MAEPRSGSDPEVVVEPRARPAPPKPPLPRWPEGRDRASYAEVVRHSLQVAIAGARDAARIAPHVEAEALNEWAARLGAAEEIWDEDGGSNAKSAVLMVEAALTATIIAGANAPKDLHVRTGGGLVAQWVKILEALDGKWGDRKPRSAQALALRIAVEWTLPDNPDRRVSAAANVLDEAAGELLFAANDGPGMDNMAAVLQIAQEEIDNALDLLPPEVRIGYSGRRVDKWASFLQQRGRTESPPRSAAETVRGAARSAAETARGAATRAKGMAAQAAEVAAGVAATAESAAQTLDRATETVTTLDRALMSVLSSVDLAFASTNRLAERVVATVAGTRRKRGRR